MKIHGLLPYSFTFLHFLSKSLKMTRLKRSAYAGIVFSESSIIKRYRTSQAVSSSVKKFLFRKVRRAYQSSWDQRCKLFFCCSLGQNRKIKASGVKLNALQLIWRSFQRTFAEIAPLLSEFFRDLDVVPSDVLVGLLLLRKRQHAVKQKTSSKVSMSAF